MPPEYCGEAKRAEIIRKDCGSSKIGILKQNYMKVRELNLNEVADYLNISVPYLAVLFKQGDKAEFWCNIVGNLRMEKAEGTGFVPLVILIGEDRRKTGYSGAQYFAVCF